LSGAWVLVVVAIIAVTAASHARSVAGAIRSATGAITQSGKVDIFSLHVGDCIQNLPAAQATLTVTKVTVVPCTAPHNAQVFAQFSATDTAYPGGQALGVETGRGCQAREATSLDQSKLTKTMALRFIFPEADPWANGLRTLTCVAMDSTQDLTSSLLSAGR
jgi:hypothetical protein